MPTTPALALPYPVATDPADVPKDIKALADKLDTFTSMHPALVSSLPGSPIDGQEVYYLADTAAGIVWQLRYRAASASAYKWEAIAGRPMIAEVDAASAPATTSYTALGGPAVVAPLAGDYDIQTEGRLNIAGPTGQPFIIQSYAIGATAPIDNDGIMLSVGAGASVNGSATRRKNVPAAATTIQSMLKLAGSGSATSSLRRLAVTPIRVG